MRWTKRQAVVGGGVAAVYAENPPRGTSVRRRAGSPLGNLCLTQRRERRGRVHSLAHQLAERALLRAACGRRGEHVFGRLRGPSDGTRTLRRSMCDSARVWL